MQPLTPKQREWWTQKRRLGRSNYIRRTGVLGWGITVGLAWSVSMAAMNGWDRLLILLPVSLVLFPIAGYFFGAWTWKMFESRYAAEPAETKS